MTHALMGVLLIMAVLLLLLTLLLIVISAMVIALTYKHWYRETGGFKGYTGPIANFFKRVKKADGSYDLVPIDEVDDNPIRDKAEEEDEAAGWEDDYMDGVDVPSPLAQMKR